ncbi:MAG TPA: aldolase/citrate lyase family protein [Vicinamibacterales bacterium]|nr:aldolase/citrate lyase family protein [Vicinamibacterales bacterium]
MPRESVRVRRLVVLMLVAAVAGPSVQARQARPAVIDLWSRGEPAFGIFVPNESPGRRGRGAADTPPPAGPPYSAAGGERLAANPLYDFVFLNLESGYDATHVRAIAQGLARGSATRRPALLVRIPPISRDGAATTAARIRDVLAAGADGVTLPHVRGVDEARDAIAMFRAAGADVWSPSNPSGRTIAMLMLEDPGSVDVAAAIADLPGYSILACGIGSLRGALGGDRDAAEAGVQRVLAESKRATLVNMLTANAQDIEERLAQGFTALLTQGAGADEAIRIGRAAAGR